MVNEIFGFIGCGNMGGALATAVARVVGGENILLANRTPEKAAALAKALGARTCDNAQAARESDFLFLGVKPHMMAGMLAGIRPVLASRAKPCVLVSMAAGLTVATIRDMAGVDCPVVRINPNTPSAVGKGLVMLCAEGIENDDPRMQALRRAMAGAGLLDDVDERLMDAGSAVAGCGPAFAALMLEALADGGVACGLPRAKAQMYAAQMMLGTAALALETGRHPGALKDAVCSPGGTTIQGVRALEKGGFRSAAFEAVIAAYQATLALAKK
jgi:pyrroline-5-carboxylate reductase